MSENIAGGRDVDLTTLSSCSISKTSVISSALAFLADSVSTSLLEFEPPFCMTGHFLSCPRVIPAAGDVHRSKAMRLIDMKYILSLGDDGSACRLKAIYSSGSGFCACLCLREIVMEVSASAMQFAYSRLQCKLIIWPQVTRGLDPSVRWHDLVLMLRMHCDALG